MAGYRACLDIVQFQIETDTREEAIELAKEQLATGLVQWIVGELVNTDDGFIVTGAEE